MTVTPFIFASVEPNREARLCAKSEATMMLTLADECIPLPKSGICLHLLGWL
jgi:hypothetical protein